MTPGRLSEDGQHIPGASGMLALVMEQEAQKRKHDLLESEVKHGFEGVNSRLDGFAHALTQANIQATNNNSMLHELRERGSGWERIHTVLERVGGTTSDDVKKLNSTVSEWKGAVKMLLVVITLVGGLGAAYVTTNIEALQRDIHRIESTIQKIHPGTQP